MALAQFDLSSKEINNLNLSENSGQVAIGSYIVQIGSVHGGVVNIAMPEQQAHWQSRLGPILLRPRRFSALLDRTAETGAAATALQTAEPLEYYGQPGLGKTSLLRHLAYALMTPTYPDGIIYLSARQQPLADLLYFLFEAFYESNIPAKPTDAHLRHALLNKRALILLDDIDLARSEVDSLLDIMPNCAFLFASPERRLWGTGQALSLRGLPAAESLVLFERELGRPLSQEEQAIAPTLCALLDGHPLYLLQAAGFVRDQNVSLVDLSHQLQQGQPQQMLAAQLLSDLSTPERRVMGLLAAFAGTPVSFEHVAPLTGLPDPAPVLEGLLQRGLIQAHSPRYSLTGSLAQAWPAQWDLTPLADRALTYFTRWVEQQPVDHLLAETDTLLHLLGWAGMTDHWPETLRLARAVEDPLALARRWDAWEQTLQSALRAAETLGDRAAKAWVWHQLGTRALCLEDMDTARLLLSRALRLRQTLGDTAGAEVTRHNLSLLLTPPPPPPQSSSPPPSPSSGAMPLLLMSAGATLVVLLLLVLGAGWWLNSQPPPAAVTLPSSTPISQVVATFTPTPTPPPSLTPTPTLSATPLPSATPIPSPTPTVTNTHTATPTPSFTPTSTPTFTPTPTPTFTPIPVALIDPASLDFGRQRVNLTGPTQFVDLYNPGPGLLMVNSIFIEGENTGDFLVDTSDCLTSTRLPVGSGCTLNVRFNPTSLGERRANLTITSNSLDSPQSVFLRGQGVGDPAVSLDPDRLDFDEQPVGVTAESQTVRLTNTGQGDLRVNNYNLTGANPADFTLTDEGCIGIILFPADSCLMSLAFTPSQTGSRSAELAITTNASGSPQRLPLNGVGLELEPDLVVSSISSDSPPIPFGRLIQVPLRVVVRNQGNTAADLFKVSTDYTWSGQTSNVAFTVPGQPDSWYPFTTVPLPPGAEVTLAGYVSVSLQLRGETIELRALADSCSGDEGLPADCRVAESNETNNLSTALAVQLPRPNSPPQAMITSPTEGQTFLANNYDPDRNYQPYINVTLSGGATDPEDGSLSGDLLVWTTNQKDLTEPQTDVLGRGSELTVRLYSDSCEGTPHTLTLTATDSDGNRGVATRSVTINQRCVE